MHPLIKENKKPRRLISGNQQNAEANNEKMEEEGSQALEKLDNQLADPGLKSSSV